MTIPTKPCASCGSPVADSALGRGAIEDVDGKRYCSPCAAKLNRSDAPEGEAVKVVYPQPSSAVIPAVKRSGPVETIPVAVPSAPAVRPGRRTTAVRSRSRKDTSRRSAVRKKPGSKRAPRGAESSSRFRAARRRDSRRIEEDPENESTRTRRLSSRASSLPWYFKLTRGQWIGISTGVGGFIVLLIIIGVALASKPRKPPSIQHNPVPYGGTPTKLMAQARQLVARGKIQEALRALEKAKEIASQNGQEHLVVQINQKIHGLKFKTVH